MAIDYSPYNEALWTDPWPVYRRMQEEAPAYYIADLDCWALTRFQDIWQASMDRQSYTATLGTSPDALFLSDALPPEVFLFMDGPAHSRHRGLLARSYQNDKIIQLDQHVRDTVRELLAPALETGTLDVYSLASRASLYTMAAFIGLERDEIIHIRSLIDRFYQREPGVRGTTDSGKQAFGEAKEFIQNLIVRYRKTPPAEHSHITTWFNAVVADRSMSDEQIFFSIFALVVTGSDTVPLATAGSIYYLGRHPDQLARLRDDPSLAAGVFEETARYDQPTNMLGRRIVKDVELHGQTLRAGQSILFLYSAACRDGREFEDPDRFDISRKQRRNLSFGTGLHFCLGQHLARLQGRVLIEEIMASIPAFEIDQARCRRVFGEFLQGYCELPIHFRPR